MTMLDVSPPPSPEVTVVGPATPLRMILRATSKSAGFVDGAWWPRSSDLAHELPALVTEAAALGYAVHRVTYSLAGWSPAPRRMTISGRLVKLGGYRTQGNASVALVDQSGWKRLVLVVVPPDASPSVADRAMRMAADPADMHRAAELLLAASRPS
jgi:hypothetical protein